MVNILAYLSLIAIWATTPIAIKWSTVDLSFAAGIFWRILLSSVLALVILKGRREKLFAHPRACKVYLVGAMGIAPNFLLVYWASERIPSGLISVIFSTVPLIITLLSYCFLKQNLFTPKRVLAFAVALSGLVIIFFDQLNIGQSGSYGLLAMAASVLVFSSSSLVLQQMGNPLSTLQTTTGGLCFSVPPLALFWWWVDGSVPAHIGWQNAASILYLGVFGSLIGFFLYFFLLHRISAHVVSTVGMVSPVFALMIGQQFAGEALGAQLIVGAVMVLLGLALYHSQSRRKALDI